MNMKLLVALSIGASVAATSTMASTMVDPEKDRQQYIEFFKSKFPDRNLQEYADGEYQFNADRMAQLEANEDFPPYLDFIDAGEEAWNKDLAVFEKCFGSDVSKIRPKYPYFNEDSQTVVTLEGDINKCRTDAGLEPYKWKKGTIANVSAYLGYNARGEKINVAINSEGAKKAFNDGRMLFTREQGQFGLSCAECHTYNPGRNARSNWLSTSLGHTSHFPVYRAKWRELGTTHRRYEGCHKNMRAVPYKVQGEEYRNLEFFNAYMNNGIEINAPAYRH